MVNQEKLNKLIDERVSEFEPISEMSDTLCELMMNIIAEYFGCDDIKDVDKVIEDMDVEEEEAFVEEAGKHFASAVMKKIFTF